MDDVAGHHVLRRPAVSTDIVQGELRIQREEPDPAPAMLFRAQLDPAVEIALGDDAQQMVLRIDDGNAADAMLDEQLGNCGNRGLESTATTWRVMISRACMMVAPD
ncbi:MAG: hypothetical protein WDN49_03110 [Acetobacteraceae bacterium]